MGSLLTQVACIKEYIPKYELAKDKARSCGTCQAFSAGSCSVYRFTHVIKAGWCPKYFAAGDSRPEGQSGSSQATPPIAGQS